MDRHKRRDLSRRDTLRVLGVITGGVLVGCSDSGNARDDAGFAPSNDGGSGPSDHAADTSSLCRATQADAKGPFFEAGAPPRMRIAGASEPGARLLLTGTVLGPDCRTPIAGALLDVWQADEQGQYFGAAESDYRLRGQVLSDEQGRWMIETVMPGHYENGPGAWRPAHIHFTVSAKGYEPVTTQLYFAGDPYLAPHDGCPSACDSSDPQRIVALSPGAGASLGTWQVVLAAS